MIVRVNPDTNNLQIVLEKKDVCRTCGIIHMCPKMRDYLEEISYISTKNKAPYTNCWLWSPYAGDEKDKENTVIPEI